MAAPSELAALQRAGAILRAAGAQPAARVTPRSPDLAEGLERLREALTGADGGGSPIAGLTREQAERYAARYKPENAQRALGGSSGWRELPQCAGCRAILKYPGAQCVACGFMDQGGYLGVPAKSTHLERWR